MALNTAICFFLTGLVLLYCESGRGYMQHLTTTLSGSIAARVLLPAAILIPTLFGLIRLWGYWEGLYDNEFGVTLFSMVTIIVMAVIGGIRRSHLINVICNSYRFSRNWKTVKRK